MKHLHKKLRAFARNTNGATAIEYGLIAALLAIAIVGGATTLGSSTNDSFNRVNQQAWGG